MTAGLRVLVADDSPTARRFLAEVLEAYPGVAVVGEAEDGAEAVKLTAELRPDIVVMDAVMPRLDGFEATARIMSETPTPVVVVTAALDPADVALALRSVEVGALTVLPKPVWDDSEGGRRRAVAFTRKVVMLSSVRVIRRYRPPAADRPLLRDAPDAARARTRVVAVAASTGGPRALHELLRGMPAGLPAPIVVVQHIADGFIEGFVRWLDAATPLAVKLARDGEPLATGSVHVAPENRHLRITAGGRMAFGDDPPIGGFRPAATALFESVAAAYGQAAAGVMLSGLGDDGVAGLLSLRATGGQILAQDEETAAVFGMPGAVVAAGLADTVGPVAGLVTRIVELTRTRER